MLISRRTLVGAIAVAPLITSRYAFSAPDDEILAQIDDLEFPAFSAIDPIGQFGNTKPNAEQLAYAKTMYNAAPKGPAPIDIARYFITVSQQDPDAVAQWPKREAWNPLVVEFFRVTNYKADNDMVPWCAAFVNWCLERGQKTHSGSAASQSFLNEKVFAKTDTPKVGDLAVFTCYSVETGKSVGLGHVAFLAGTPGDTLVPVLGGNQTNDGKSMICMKKYPVGPIRTTRTVSGTKTPVDFRLNRYVRVV